MLPALVLTVGVLGAAFGTALMQSLGLMPLVGPPELSLQAYRTDGLLNSAGLSLAIATAATALAAVIGLATALLVAASGPGRRLLTGTATLTIPLPHLVGAAAIGLLLADFGLLARVFGATDGGWPPLVGGPWWVAVVVEFAWKEAAFVALVLGATLATRIARYEETAVLLGAGRCSRLRHVTLPLLTPALVISSAISFVYALGSYEVPALLGRASPEPLPVLAYRLFTSIQLTARPQAAAAAMVTAALAIGVLVLTLLALRRSPAWR